MAINYDDLPSAPSSEEREEMILALMSSDDYRESEACEALIKNIRDGNIVVLQGEFLQITKEGYDLFKQTLKGQLN